VDIHLIISVAIAVEIINYDGNDNVQLKIWILEDHSIIYYAKLTLDSFLEFE